MSTNQYQEMRNRQQAEINAFPMFFAFNKQQFAEGMQHTGPLSFGHLPDVQHFRWRLLPQKRCCQAG